MSLFDLQKAWQQAIDEARLRQLQREEMADGELRRCAGIAARSDVKGGVMEGCPPNASITVGENMLLNYKQCKPFGASTFCLSTFAGTIRLGCYYNTDNPE